LAKRLLDTAAALIGLIVLAPVFAVVGLLVKLDSPGPVFFHGRRIGQDGRVFDLIKFRSMVIDAPEKGPAITCRDDPRVTRIGRLLRKSKLDELPGLINVLRGEMSLVGPRPEAPVWVERYSPRQRAVLTVKPGITGLTQVKYRNEEQLLTGASLDTDYAKLMNDKLDLDLHYVENRSLGLDIRILTETAVAVIRGLR
jgi:lipopolysaccharide/colanic/teichoic acid biosynthesis glycosyltransferase